MGWLESLIWMIRSWNFYPDISNDATWWRRRCEFNSTPQYTHRSTNWWSIYLRRNTVNFVWKEIDLSEAWLIMSGSHPRWDTCGHVFYAMHPYVHLSREPNTCIFQVLLAYFPHSCTQTCIFQVILAYFPHSFTQTCIFQVLLAYFPHLCTQTCIFEVL